MGKNLTDENQLNNTCLKNEDNF